MPAFPRLFNPPRGAIGRHAQQRVRCASRADRPPKILAFPRDTQTPYQRLLYGELQRMGCEVRFLGQLTSSRTLNLMALPLELATRRLAGWRLVHLHWISRFALPGADRIRALRWVAQAWFIACLLAIRLLGMRPVWTAHNVLPHAPVFANDVTARRALARACDLVIAHTAWTLDELAALGVIPSRTAVIAHGPLSPAMPADALRVPGQCHGPRRFLFFGRLEQYKGVDDLLVAFGALPAHVDASLTVAGECEDGRLQALLEKLAQVSARIVLRPGFVPYAEVTPLLAGFDVVVLPYRRITTSGTAMLALGHGRPLIVPDLAALTDLPRDAVMRYDGTVSSLTATLARAACADRSELAAMSAAALAYSSQTTWREVAARTMSELASVLDRKPGRPSRPSGVRNAPGSSA